MWGSVRGAPASSVSFLARAAAEPVRCCWGNTRSSGRSVVLARHTRLQTTVALKFLRKELAGDPALVSRFEREARAASRLRSEHSCRVFDFEQGPDGDLFIAMEYLEGESLEARRHRTRLSEGQVVSWAIQVLDALEEAHSHGVVHRDLKPANLFLARRADGSERVVVLDFGLAKSSNPEIEQGLSDTTRGHLIGSPAYMSPEQLTPYATIDHRTDLWSHGCTMFVLLTGELPFRGRDLLELAHHVRTAAPAAMPSWVSIALGACIASCLEKDPKDRPQSASELKARLKAVAQQPAVRRASPARVAASVLAVALVGGALVIGVSRQATDARVRRPAASSATRGAPPATARPTRRQAQHCSEAQPSVANTSRHQLAAGSGKDRRGGAPTGRRR